MEHIWNRFGDASYIHEEKKNYLRICHILRITNEVANDPTTINPDAVVKKGSKRRRLISLAKASKKLHKGFRAVLDKIMKRLRQRIRVKGLDRLRRQFRCRCFAVPRLPAPPRTRSRTRTRGARRARRSRRSRTTTRSRSWTRSRRSRTRRRR